MSTAASTAACSTSGACLPVISEKALSFGVEQPVNQRKTREGSIFLSPSLAVFHICFFSTFRNCPCLLQSPTDLGQERLQQRASDSATGARHGGGLLSNAGFADIPLFPPPYNHLTPVSPAATTPSSSTRPVSVHELLLRSEILNNLCSKPANYTMDIEYGVH
ncbi:hypothetical protein PR202_ga13652 [Eleusine coracana subsp. coracana]|uniref:Uncharacterized protein n=1 Tax=Eleusine coracana subsp. coracana TaxID=191504 RepID=A0AAV5CFH8_ELECO|nr:hypothetical protein PR202_ga13652 [Eleusine coracana subsp. coracana]